MTNRSVAYVKTDREEVLNTLTHGFGLILSVIALSRMIYLAGAAGGARHLVSVCVFGATLIGVYAASTLYHSARDPRRKQLFLTLDYTCIYFLIAGTYTPFTLVLMRGGWGWSLFGVVWGLAAVGIIARLIAGKKLDALGNATYIAMGWAVVIFAYPIITTFPSGCIFWLVAGGVFYTVGVLFQIQRREYMHTAWHLFVLAGSACHYIAVVRYVLGTEAWW